MYISSLKLWNFRQFGKNGEEGDNLNRKADLAVPFNEGLNLLVGENDSGKSTIVDAINYIVIPYSHEYLKINSEDFHLNQKKMRIECEFTGFSVNEAKNFIEYLSIVGDTKKDIEESDDEWIERNIYNLTLRLFLEADLKDETVSWYDLKSGYDDEGTIFRGEIRDFLKSMYLKPLRNAKIDLRAQPGSRLSKVLSKHKNFIEEGIDHPLKSIFLRANSEISKFFKGIIEYEKGDESHPDQRGKQTTDEIHTHLSNLFSKRNQKSIKFDISDPKLEQILQKISLELEEKKSGLGALNLLYMAVELLLLKRKEHSGLHLGIVEEAEAHLHTQAQMRVLKYLQELSDDKSQPIQLILTTHSTQIASEVNLKNLIILNKGKAFPMGDQYTELDKSDYAFLERFLDATKANLFFAEGVILVEGDAENLLIPTIARIVGRDLVDYGVSIVNVGHTGLFRYSNIFLRKFDSTKIDEKITLDIPVACIKDNDCNYYIDETTKKLISPSDEQLIISKNSKITNSQKVEIFVSDNKTLEFDIALDDKLREDFYRAVLYANKAMNAVAHIFITDEKKEEADDMVTKNFKEWEKSELSNAEIAFAIYRECENNKSLTANFYAQILETKKNDTTLMEYIKTKSKIKYIIDAIEYVTEPFKKINSNESK